MEPANEQSLGTKLLQSLNGFIDFKLRTKQTEWKKNGSNDKGGSGARKKRKLMRAEAARRRSTPQPPPPPPALPCGRCVLLCTCLPPPSPPPSPALTTNNNGLELVTETNNLIFSQIIDLDKLLSAALGVREEKGVNMKNIVVKVEELIKENVDMRNILKELDGKIIQPREICARQQISVAVTSQQPGQHIPVARVSMVSQTPGQHFPVDRASKQPGQDKATAMSEASNPVVKASRLHSQVFSNKNNSDFSGKDWFWGKLPIQKAYEIMRESAQPGHYLVLQSDDQKFRFVWKAGNDTIKIKYCGLLHFIKENRFDDETWNYSVQSLV